MGKIASSDQVIEGDWDFGYLMPQISFPNPIENEYLAIVPFSDARLIKLADAHKGVQVLVRGMTDSFGRECQPSALLIRKNAPSSINFAAILDFRNAIAISSLIDGSSLQLSGGNAGYPQWSDYFDFYCYASTKDGNDLIGQSLALTGVDRPSKFSGQAASYLPPSSCIHPDVDDSMLESLLFQWKRKHLNKGNDRSTRVLFRSLQVASTAARLPGIGTRFPTIHDLGLSVAMWVSAFEVLTHPGSSDANQKTVLDCLELATWASGELRAKRYQSKSRSGKTIRKINFCQRLYTELYRARNDFLHGNRVERGHLFPFRNQALPSLPACAILIYRSVLEGFLEKLPSGQKQTSAAPLEEWFENAILGRRHEDALKAVMQKQRES